MRRNSIQRRLIATVLLSQSLLTVGLVLTGVAYTYWRLLSTLDTGMQSHALRVGALVRYVDNSDGKVYFDNTLLPPPLDPEHQDLFAVWASRSLTTMCSGRSKSAVYRPCMSMCVKTRGLISCVT